MESAIRKEQHLAPAIPLVNLFAYIRDLFQTHTGTPSFRDAAGMKYWWPLAEWTQLQEELEQKEKKAFQFQWHNPDQPLLRLKRLPAAEAPKVPKDLQAWVRIFEGRDGQPQLQVLPQVSVKFTDQPARKSAFRRFQKQIKGKTVEAVSSLPIPIELQGWINMEVVDEKLQISPIEQQDEPLEADSLRRELWEAFQRVFDAYQATQKRVFTINHLFDELHAAFHEYQSAEDIQISLSFGLLSGILADAPFHQFLFQAPLKLSLEKQEIRLTADTLTHAIQCEDVFTEYLGEHFSKESEDLINHRKLAVLSEIDRFNKETRSWDFDPAYVRRTYYQAAKKMLDVFPRMEDQFFIEGQLNTDFSLQTSGLQLSFAPVIQIKQGIGGAHIAQDAEKIMSQIHELGVQDQNHLIPEFFKKLFSLRKPGSPLRIAYRRQDRAVSSPSIQEVMPERFLFPLAFNDEQMAIAKRLLEQDAVTVQGPPGTGKSHTIANLTSHFVAEGKSILIVSKNAKALEVIKGKLPGELQQLAVSILPGSEHADELKHAIDGIKDHLSRTYEQEEIFRMEQEWDQLEAAKQAHLQSLAEMIGTHFQTFRLLNPQTGESETLSLMDWVRLWQKLPQGALQVPDAISHETALAELAQRIWDWWTAQPPQVEALGEGPLPTPETLPDSESIRQLCEARDQIGQSLDIPSYREQRLPTDMEAWQTTYQELENQLPEWLELEEQFTALGRKPAQLQSFLEGLKTQVESLQKEELQWVSFQMDLASLSEWDEITARGKVEHLKEKYSGQEQLSGLKKRLLSGELKSIFTCRINGKSVQTLSELNTLSQWLAYQTHISQLATCLNNFLHGGKAVVTPRQALAAYQQWEERLAGWEGLAQMNQRLTALGVAPLPGQSRLWPDYMSWLKGIPAYRQWENLQAQLAEASRQLYSHEVKHPVLEALRDAVMQRDPHGYEKHWQDLLSWHAAEQQQVAWEAEAASLAEALPETIAQLQAGSLQLSDKESWQTALFARQIESLLQEQLAAMDEAQAKLGQMKHLQKEQEALTIRLVGYKAWFHKQQKVTDAQRSALTAWRNDLVNIGKGHGKNTKRNMQSAVRNLHLAKDVVPVWIMAQDTAIQFFPEPQPGQFDLLIVDEASQCDISMLNLVYRAKKSIVVGDENQTSVSTNSRLFPLERTNRILDRYLVNHPFKQQFHINNRTASIYTLSGVIYPNIIGLREHFRCHPDIIAFSNRYVYDQQIVPLRTVQKSWLGAATEAHYIQDELDDKVRPNLIQQVVSLIADLIEDAEQGHIPSLPTVGILCLEASNDAHREQLIKALGRHKLIKAYQDQLELAIGSSREFQGDERDVIILTSTASHKINEQGIIRPPR
ncbi:MAG: AAA domain-containing protein, partial [Bacteroidota bacterium]